MLILLFNRMFSLEPELKGLDVPAWMEFTEDRSRMKEADVVVFHVPSLSPAFFRRKRPGQLWVAWYMECEQNYRRLRDPGFMGRFDLHMSHRQKADVMTSYIPESLRTLQPGSLPDYSPQRLICSFISGYVDRSGRTGYLQELSRHLDIHQFGRCGDRIIADDRGAASKREISSAYKFSFAFENAIAPDYVTEKFFDPLIAGSVPVYLGAPNIDCYAPVEDCFINAADYPDPKDLATHLLRLDQDESAYRRLLHWRERPFTERFKVLCERSCRSAFEGLGQLLDSMEHGQ